MISSRWTFFVSLALCLFANVSVAQYTVKNIVFDQPGQCTQAALEAASGLKPGTSLSTADLRQTAQRLVDTGAFDDLQVTLDGPAKAITVLFKVKPLDPARRVPVTFDNLVWFTPGQLDAGLRARVPLYAATLPESGNLQSAVDTALLAMLQDQGVTATVSHQLYEPTSEHPLRVIAYRVQSPAVVLHGLHLSGVTAEFGAAVHDGAAKLVGGPYTEGSERPSTTDALLAPLRNAGYLDAQIAGKMLAPAASTPERVDVDLTGTVVPGPRFHVRQIAWTGSSEMGAQAFATAAPLHTGDLASVLTLAKTVDLLATLYRAEGYNDVVVGAGTSLDKAAGTVAYTFTVTPGAVYRVRSVTPLNLSAAQQTDFARGWTLKPDDVYNPEYIKTFLKRNTALRSFEGYAASYKAVSDPETHQVDITLTFVRGAGLPR